MSNPIQVYQLNRQPNHNIMRPAFESNVFQNYGTSNSRQSLEDPFARRTLDSIIQKDRDSSFLENFEQRQVAKRSSFVYNELERTKPHASTINITMLQDTSKIDKSDSYFNKPSESAKKAKIPVEDFEEVWD